MGAPHWRGKADSHRRRERKEGRGIERAREIERGGGERDKERERESEREGGGRE